MRRGGHGFKFQAPWRRHDDPTQSSIPCEQVEGFGFSRLVALAALTIAISMGVLQWRRHEPTKHDLGASKPGFLFPLYGYSYRQFRNASTGSEGTLWRGHRGAAHHRALQQTDDYDDDNSGPFFELKKGFYITMKLGIPPKEFTFSIDTGSRSTWVHCKRPRRVSKFRDLGPNGMYEAKRESTMKCLGNTADLCVELQHQNKEKCIRRNQYDCLFRFNYADSVTVTGVFVSDSMTLPLQDKSEVDVHSYFGCATQRHDPPEIIPTISDGLVGFGNCQSTLAYQWFENNLINQNVISFCIAKTIEQRAKMGYVAVGIDFNEKFEEGNSAYLAWAPIVQHYKNALCAYPINLLYITFLGNIVRPQADRVPMVVDTGSERTYLEAELYDPLLKVGKEISPINDFPLMKFSIEGEVDDSGGDVILDLNVQPDGYLEWNAKKKRLCVNINKEDNLEFPNQNFGAQSMKEHLFVIDFYNQRIRWQPNKCESP